MNKYTITNTEGNTLEVQELELDNHKVRVAWDNVNRTFYFSVVDVVGVLTEQLTTRNATYYWGQIKTRLKKEGANELFTNCQQLKLRAADGKLYSTDVADKEQLFRIIQSIPSKKAEPIKQWLAKVGEQLKKRVG